MSHKDIPFWDCSGIPAPNSCGFSIYTRLVMSCEQRNGMNEIIYILRLLSLLLLLSCSFYVVLCGSSACPRVSGLGKLGKPRANVNKGSAELLTKMVHRIARAQAEMKCYPR